MADPGLPYWFVPRPPPPPRVPTPPVLGNVEIRLLTLEAVAACLRCTVEHVRRLIRAGTLPAVVVSPRRAGVRDVDLLAYIAARRSS